MAASTFNVFVGAETGLLKGVNSKNENFMNLGGKKITSRDKEINVMCWSDDSENKISIGRREGVVECYDLNQETVTDSVTVNDGTGPLKGLSMYRGKYVACRESGHLMVVDSKSDEKHVFDVGKNICRMRQSSDKPSIVATGGKENDLKLWDLTKPDQPVFKAKNVANDWLDLRVPVWVTDIRFLNDEKIAVCTGTHSVRVYDPKCRQRRPVLEAKFDEYPFTCLAIPNDQNYAVVGNTKGNMALMDLRKKAMVHVYKGFAGSIRSVECHPREPIIASCGLDRFLRIHDFNSRNLLHKIYLKSRLNCLLLRENYEDSPEDQNAIGGEQVDLSEKQVLPHTNDDEEDDKLWDSFKPVQIKRKKKLKPDYNSNLTKRLSANK